VADKLVALNAEDNAENITINTSSSLRPDSGTYCYAGSTASIKKVLSEVKIKYSDSSERLDWSRMYPNREAAVVNGQQPTKNTIPNVKGMGLKDALYLMETLDVKVVAKGKGKVVHQSIDAGMLIQKNQIVTLELD
jgi:cell division protein FtsI (penicillin-binding protein 3)